MPRRDNYVPKHRGAAPEPALKKGVRKSVLFSGVAVLATGMAVSSGIVVMDAAPGDQATASLASGNTDRDAASTGAGAADPADRPDPGDQSGPGNQSDLSGLSDREVGTSRSDRRTSGDALAQKGLDQQPGGQATRTEDLSNQNPRDLARAMLPEFGFSADQFSCLDALYASESGWNVHADNPSSSAYGIPQALPGSKMASAGPDWAHNPATQIRWGLGYIRNSYGTPCSAWSFKQSHNWY